MRGVCKDFPDTYWRDLDRRREYPTDFVKTLTDLGYLSVLIPEQYGGGGLGVTEAAAIVEEINRSGGNGGACHAQMYTMGSLVRHGSDDLKQRYLPRIASGELRLQAFGVTEPDAGSDTTHISTRAVKQGDTYVINGRKIFTSRILQSDLMVLLARTEAYEDVERKTDGMTLFLVDLREAGAAVQVTPVEIMFNQHTNQVYFSDLEVPAVNVIGREGMGFRHLLDGLNTERILIASEAIGDGRWFVDRAREYASTR
ncbi:MAG TPA: acyl-CoA dehydrogenase family protein, partial [Dehalococcoidia bacterium]